jgi:hypothetical protein
MKTILAGVLAFALAVPVLEAQAFTLAPLSPGDSLMQQVRQGCGAGYRRGPYGGCIRQTAPVGPYGANQCWFINGGAGPMVCRR